MRLKGGVQWVRMSPAMWAVRAVADEVTQGVFGRDAICTSARRKKTPGGSSLHPKGEALDLRTRDMPAHTQRTYRDRMKAKLGDLSDGYDVVLEGPASEDKKLQERVAHLHVENDPD